LESENSDVVRWMSHGLAFKVFDSDRFTEEIIPKYFKRKSKFHTTSHFLLCSMLILFQIQSSRASKGSSICTVFAELLEGRTKVLIIIKTLGADRRRLYLKYAGCLEK